MQHSNCYSNVKNTDHSITSLNMGEVALSFLFYGNFNPTLPPSPPLRPSPAYLVLPNVPTEKICLPYSCKM